MTPVLGEGPIDVPRIGGSPEVEMDREIEAHLAMRVEDLMQQGWSEADARAEAERRFGTLREARRELRDAARRREATLRHRDLRGALLADLRFAIRQLRRSAGHSLLTVITLALGIGMTTAIFTLIERIVVRPLPFPQAARLVTMAGQDSLHQPIAEVSAEDWLDWRDGTSTFTGMAIYGFPLRQGVVIGDSALRLNVVTASGDFFGVLGARFMAGRSFTDQEAQDGLPVAVVSEGVWRSLLGADRALARTLTIGTGHYRVVGVVATEAGFPAGIDVWVGLRVMHGAGGELRNNVNYQAIGRLRPGVTLSQASADLQRVSHAIRGRDPAGRYDYGATVEPLASLVVGTDVVSSLRLLLLAGAVVLLLVCVNLAIATLGRGAARQWEMALRTSLGATRARLVGLLLVEQMLRALIGGVAGVAIAWVTLRGVIAAWGASIPRASEIHLDLTVLAFALGLSLVAGLASGLVPALRGSRVALQDAMRQGNRTATGGQHRFANALVMIEFTLALVLLTGAGLLIRSFQMVIRRDLGFDRRVATVQVTLAGPQYADDPARRLLTWEGLLDRYASLPGVQSAGVANWAPLGIAAKSFLEFADRPDLQAGAGYRVVSERYLPTMGVRLLRGRGLEASDRAGAPRVAVINESMARAYFPDRNPLGQQVRASSMERGPNGEPAPWLTIVGVVSDLHQWGAESAPEPELFTSFRQAPAWTTLSMTAVIRSAVPAPRLFQMLRTATREVDPLLAADYSTFELEQASQLAPRRLTMSLLAIFAALALALAVLGIYATLSYAVAQRSRELAVRAALGAQRLDLIRLVFARGATVLGLGIAAGVFAGVGLSRVMTAMLFGVQPLDPASFGGAIALLGGAGLLATLLPALRATRADPLTAMKGE